MPVTLDASTYGQGSPTASFSHTVASGATLLVARINKRGGTVTSCTWDGAGMTQVFDTTWTALYYKTNPTSGTKTAAVTVSGDSVVMDVASYFGTSTTAPLSTPVTVACSDLTASASDGDAGSIWLWWATITQVITISAGESDHEWALPSGYVSEGGGATTVNGTGGRNDNYPGASHTFTWTGGGDGDFSMVAAMSGGHPASKRMSGVPYAAPNLGVW